MKPTSALFFSVKDEEKAESIKKILEEKEIEYTYNRYKEFMLSVDVDSIKKNTELISEIHLLRHKQVNDDE